MCERLDALLPDDGSGAAYTRLSAGPGKVGLDSLLAEIDKLEMARAIGLPLACRRETRRKKEALLPCGRSGDTDGIRASKVEHAVEDLDGDGDLGDLCLVGVKA